MLPRISSCKSQLHSFDQGHRGVPELQPKILCCYQPTANASWETSFTLAQTMHIAGQRFSTQVSLLHFSPRVRPSRTARRERQQRRYAAHVQAQSASKPLTLFSPSKVSEIALHCTQPIALLFTPDLLTQINLFLRIMRRREDGFHDLASLFHVSRFDVLSHAPTAKPYRSCFLNRLLFPGD